MKLFPLMIVTLIVALAGPMAVDLIGGLTLDLTAQTVEAMQ